MVPALKRQQPAPGAPFRPSRERRVAFTEPITEDSTDETSQSSSAAGPCSARGVPERTPSAYGSRPGFWCPACSHYRPVATSLTAPRGALIRTPQSPPMRSFAQRPLMPPRTYWTKPPPPWSNVCEPFLAADAFSEAPLDDGRKSLMLRAASVGLLLAALVTAVIFTALVIDLQAPSGTSALPHVVESADSGDVKIAVPRHPRNFAAKGILIATLRPAAAASRTVDQEPPAHTTFERRGHTRPDHRLQPVAKNHTRRLPRQCGRHFYTYCHNQKSEAFYSTSSHACVAAAVDSVRVCNRGVNRFSSLGSCVSSCVHADRGREDNRCHESTLFTACSRPDVVQKWWFFDGSTCTRWSFPLGSCPSEQDGGVFRSRRECATACLHPNRNETAYAHQCNAPMPATCSPQQIQYPYFADMSLEGSARCVVATHRTLVERRCLIGSNQFDSIESCKRNCVPS